MINYNTRLVEELKKSNLPVYHEHFLTKDSKLPCVSYLLTNDIQSKTAETYGYSNVYYHITVWAKTPKELMENSKIIDEILRSIGFKRRSAQEVWLDPNIGQMAMSYEGLAFYNMEE